MRTIQTKNDVTEMFARCCDQLDLVCLASIQCWALRFRRETAFFATMKTSNPTVYSR
jgi:hypothetical protein